jgi:WD40 repeat protein
MFIKPFHINSRVIVTNVLSPNRVVIASYNTRDLIRIVELPETCGHALDISSDGRYLVTGHWESTPVTIWDLETGGQVRRFGPVKVSGVLLSAAGNYVLVKSAKGSAVFDAESDSIIPIKRCGATWSSCTNPIDNSMLIAMERKGKILVARSNPLRVEEVNVDTPGAIWLMRCSPQNDCLLLMDSTGGVTCSEGLNGRTRWRLKFSQDQKSSEGSFSPNGKLVAIGSGDKRYLSVYDASTGVLLRRIDINAGAFWPLESSRIMTCSGEVVDLERGVAEEGVSNWRWWRAVGA